MTKLLDEGQIAMARHALGLDVQKTSFRNRYVVGDGSMVAQFWDDMVDMGFANKSKGLNGSVWYYMTKAGAEAVLRDGEKLCKEDFP